MSFEHFVSLITRRSLWFSKPNHFDDTSEGWYPAIHLPDTARTEDTSNTFDLFQSQIARNHYELRNSMFLNCWHINSTESVPMWKAYTPQGRGVAIRSTVGRLKECVASTPYTVYSGKVTYQELDSPQPIRKIDPVRIFFVKRPQFTSEQEFRLLAWSYDEGDLVSTCPGIEIPVDLLTLLDQVVISPDCWSHWQPLLESFLAKLELPPTLIVRSIVDEQHAFAKYIDSLAEREKTISAFERVEEQILNGEVYSEKSRSCLARSLAAYREYLTDQKWVLGIDFDEVHERSRAAAERSLLECNGRGAEE